MKKNVDREIANQYIYDYGWDGALEILEITEEEMHLILDDSPKDWKKPHLNKNANLEYINPNISKYIEKNYEKLKDKYVKTVDNNILFQSDEDIFHTSLIKLCNDLSNPTESKLNKEFDRIYRISKWQYQKEHNHIKQKEKYYANLEFTEEETEE